MTMEGDDEQHNVKSREKEPVVCVVKGNVTNRDSGSSFSRIRSSPPPCNIARKLQIPWCEGSYADLQMIVSQAGRIRARDQAVILQKDIYRVAGNGYIKAPSAFPLLLI